MNKKTVVGVWGAGVVGSATGYIFEQLCPEEVDVVYYDLYKEPYKENKLDLLKRADFIFVCLPTPMSVTGEVCLKYIEQALSEINSSALYKPGTPVIIRSTSVSGSTDDFATFNFTNLTLAFCPEFLTEANSLKDALEPKRIFIGVENPMAFVRIEELFNKAFNNHSIENPEIIKLTRKEAETIKYVHNVMLACQVMIANELYFICKKLDVNYPKLQCFLYHDKRIGTHTQVPGPDGDYGFGGKCFPKDLAAFIYLAEQNGYEPKVLKAVQTMNEHVRVNKDWLEIPGAVEENENFEK